MPGNYDDCPCHSHQEGDDLRIRGREQIPGQGADGAFTGI